MFLRAISENRVGGVLIPFNVRDKYGNFWRSDTDLEIDNFRQRPVFWWHRLKQESQRAGYLDDESYELRSDGLYGEAVIFDNAAGRAIMEAVRANDAQWSTGTMPHWWSETPDGFVQKWPFIEASVAPAEAVVSQRGTTTVRHVRSFAGDALQVEESDDDELRRSVAVAERFRNGGQDVTQVDMEQWREGIDADLDAAADKVKSLETQVTEIAGNVRTLLDRPGRELPEQNGHERAADDIVVHSRWDPLSLFAMALYHEVRMSGGRTVKPPGEDFYRALAHKVEGAHRRDREEIERRGELRTLENIDEDAYQAWHRKLPHLRANEAMGSTLANSGDELVPTLLSSVFWREVFLETKVAQQLPLVTMPSQPWDYPTIGAGPTVRLVSEITDQTNFTVSNSIIPTSKIATDKVVFSAGKVGAMSLASEELFEDTVNIDVLRVFTESFRIAMAQAMDELVLSGDESTGIANISHNGVDPAGSAFDKILAVDGLRHMAFNFTSSTAVAHTTISADSGLTLQKLLGARGRLGIDPSRLVFICDPGVYYALAALDAFESLADMGPQATLLTGMVGQIKGVPVVVSDQLENTDLNGFIPSTHNATKGSFLVVYRPGVIVGKRRDVMIDNAVVPGADGRAVWGTVRFDLQPMEEGVVSYGYNTTV